jgi:hypothetical protein
MPRIFSVIQVFTFRDEEIPAEFTFDVPVDGDYYFIQDGEDVFLYIEGRTDADTIKVEGRTIIEGDEIPDRYEVQAILAALIEEEVTWVTIVTNKPASALTAKSQANTWKKKF